MEEVQHLEGGCLGATSGLLVNGSEEVLVGEEGFSQQVEQVHHLLWSRLGETEALRCKFMKSRANNETKMTLWRREVKC